MQVAMDTQAKRRRPAGSWRIAVDRAWRSTDMRRTFEAETGLAPLKIGSEEEVVQSLTGATKNYHERFLVWATSYLGLERQAPPTIQEKLARG